MLTNESKRTTYVHKHAMHSTIGILCNILILVTYHSCMTCPFCGFPEDTQEKGNLSLNDIDSFH